MSEELVPIFRVGDCHEAADWYATLGFELIGEHRFSPDLPTYAFLARGPSHLHLSEHVGDAPPASVAYFYVDDVESIAGAFGVAVTDQPWARETELTDPWGNRIRVGQLPPPT